MTSLGPIEGANVSKQAPWAQGKRGVAIGYSEALERRRRGLMLFSFFLLGDHRVKYPPLEEVESEVADLTKGGAVGRGGQL